MDAWASPYLTMQAAYLRHLAAASRAAVVEEAGVYAVRTRVNSNTENGVLSAAGARVSAGAVQRLIGWFHEWAVPASWLCAEGDGRPATAAVLESAGCQPEGSAWEMSARLRALDLDDANLPVGTRIEPVTSEPALDGWLDVAGACGWFETEQERRAMRMLYLELGLASSTPFRLHVALSGEAAIGMASAFYTDDAVLLTSAAVRPDRRREGIGRALALTRLREARERRCEHAVLAPSPDGAKLYETLGLEIHPQPSGRCFYLPPSPETSPTGAA